MKLKFLCLGLTWLTLVQGWRTFRLELQYWWQAWRIKPNEEKKNINIFRVSHFCLQISLIMRSKDRLLIFLLLLFLASNLLLFLPFPSLSCSSLLSSEEREKEKFVACWAKEQQQRRANVAKGCASDLSWMEYEWERSPNNRQAHFIYNPDHNILACLQPKVTDHLTELRFILIPNRS